ncbi:MAG: putative cytokinetic ring protein SteA [Solirubrobacteraceae bacterium]
MPATSAGALPGGDVAPWRTVTGPVRPGRRTKLLVKHLSRGDIALIDHLDIDRVSAEELIAADVGAVLNCRASSSGTYPNLGPQLLVEAGVHLIDLPDDSLFALLDDGEAITVRDGEVARDGEILARGEVLDLARVRAETDARRREIGEALERFAHNTIEHMREERELLSGKIEMPRFATDFRDRAALVVVRGVGHQRDLRALRPFIRDMRPVLIAVDGGAEALLDEGLHPDMIVGDMDSAGEATLTSAAGGGRGARARWGASGVGASGRSGGAELVVHAYPDGRAPGRERLERLDLPFKLVPAPGTSQDVAMLIAAEKGANLIVSVGSQFNLVEFLDRNREGMSSTFLTRLRIGEILVDAKGVSRLYHPRPGLTPLLVVVAAGLLAMIAVVWLTPALRDVVDLLWLKLQALL